MNLKQPDSPASLQLSSQRKRDLLDHFETNGDELDRWRQFNVAYHEDDLKFMRFLIPPGKRVLELGCGRGDLLAALAPSYGVGIDFGARTVDRARQQHPGLHFVLGDVEDPDSAVARERAKPDAFRINEQSGADPSVWFLPAKAGAKQRRS